MKDNKNLYQTEGVKKIYDNCLDRCRCKHYKFNEELLDALNMLRSRSRIPFNKENSVHYDLLKQFWHINFADLEFPAEGKSDKWKEIGFQGKDPGTDFRGAGLFGLEQLVYLASNYPQEYNAMISSAKNYSFAISALNITVKFTQHLLMCYFQLHKNIAVGITGGRALSVRFLWTFCALNAADFDTINEIYVAAVIKMHDTWKEMNKIRKVNVMQFNTAILAAGDFVVRILGDNPQSMLELKRLAFS